MARSFISIFIPILILNAGYSIGTVINYYVLYNLIDVPFNFLARYLVKKIGARKVIILATFFSIAFFTTISYLDPSNLTILLLLALFAAIYDAFYWVAHIFLFIESTHEGKSSSKDTGIFYIVQKLGGLLGPAIGAVFILFHNETYLIILSIIFFLLSMIPLIKAKDLPDKPEKEEFSFKEFFSTQIEKRDYLSSTLYAIHAAAETVIWPLFIFVVFESIESVALVPIMVAITTMFFSYIAGVMNKKYHEKAIILGAFMMAVVWILRIFIENSAFYYISIFLIGLFSILITIPVDISLFSRGRTRDPLSASTYRNTFHMGAKFIFYGILAILINVFHVSFVVAAISLIGLAAFNLVFIGRQNGRTKLPQPIS
jgi:MFS family permease